MASGIYNRFKANLMNKEVDLEADTINVGLLSTSHSFTATHNTWSQVSGNELANGNGYTTGGAALAGKAVAQAATTSWDATDTSWSSFTGTPAFAVIYDDTVATDDLICCIDFGGAQTVTAGTLTIQWSASGIITLA